MPRSLQPLPLETAVRAGSVVVRQGEPSPPMQVVDRGAFVVEVVRHDGRRLVLDVLGPGDGVGWPDGADERPHRPGDRAGAASRGACATRRRARRRRCWPGGPNAPRGSRPTWRGSTCLRGSSPGCGSLAERFGHPVPGGQQIGLRLTHDDLADLCGTTRESVDRSMGELVR